MSNRPAPNALSTAISGLAEGGDRWSDLLALVRSRLVVATLALPIGVLMSPDGGPGAWWMLWWSLLALGGVSALFWLGVRIRRWAAFQGYLQVAVDLALVTVIAALTGGRDSQFALFYTLVVITGGLLNRMAGGLAAAVGACAAYLALPLVAGWCGVPHEVGVPGALPPQWLLFAYFVVMGVMAGMLGERVQRVRRDLERTTRELDRVRVDNDVILRHLATGILTVEGRGLIAYLNPAAEQVLGVRSAEWVGRPIQDTAPDRLHPLRDLILGTLHQRNPRSRAEIQIKTPSGKGLPLGISTNVLMHEGKLTGVVAVFQDLTDVREMERRVRRNETLAELGGLAARIAHELRNGLNPISGSVECLQRELKLEGENAVLMELIGAECTRLNRFVTDLLSYSRERDLGLELLDLEEELGELADLVGRDPRCAPGTAVSFVPVRRPAPIHGDREQLRQVWLNLAANALEAMPRGGTLTIRWAESGGQQFVVEFEDGGGGIGADDLKMVGQPFFTTKERGTGLGVAIAQRIVERHGGTLSFESAAGRGTIARVTLPAVVAAALAA